MGSCITSLLKQQRAIFLCSLCSRDGKILTVMDYAFFARQVPYQVESSPSLDFPTTINQPHTPVNATTVPSAPCNTSSVQIKCTKLSAAMLAENIMRMEESERNHKEHTKEGYEDAYMSLDTVQKYKKLLRDFTVLLIISGLCI